MRWRHVTVHMAVARRVGRQWHAAASQTTQLYHAAHSECCDLSPALHLPVTLSHCRAFLPPPLPPAPRLH